MRLFTTELVSGKRERIVGESSKVRECVRVLAMSKREIQTQSSRWQSGRLPQAELKNYTITNRMFRLTLSTRAYGGRARSELLGKPSAERVVRVYSVRPHARTHTHTHAHVLLPSDCVVTIPLIKSSNFLLIACFGIIFGVVWDFVLSTEQYLLFAGASSAHSCRISASSVCSWYCAAYKWQD